ncbi:MAG: FprA family A-type flavoprotein [Bacteroidetes bacterium]|nr:FprA family A-type flavoprotein [Bacteroidota bacterium]
MKKDDRILDVSPDVKWIGILDYDIVTFDVVMETKYGTTYNSYFIDAEKKTLIETSKEKFWDVYLEKLNRVCDPSKIEYIVLDHTEPDHSGNVKNILKLAPQAVVVGSGNAIRYLSDLMETEFRSLAVKDGDTLSLGNKTLRFISAPNLHWPDSIYTYLVEDKILFTCDSFGAHYCDAEMFDDTIPDHTDSFKYYFDVILKPYSKFMIRAIEKIKPLDISVVCPGHGPILRHNWKKWVDLSEEYAREYLSYPVTNKVFIPYVSAYHKTGLLAEHIALGIKKAGEIEVVVMDIENTSIGDLDAQMTSSSAVLAGCPTINQNILLPVYKLFAVINPIRDHKKLAGGFGSYGWSGEGKQLIESALKNLKLSYFEDGIFVKFSPDVKDLKMAEDYGFRFGKKLLENASQ